MKPGSSSSNSKEEVKQTELKQTELKQTELKQTELKQTELKQTELKQTELKQTELKQTELKQTELKQTKLFSPHEKQLAAKIMLAIDVILQHSSANKMDLFCAMFPDSDVAKYFFGKTVSLPCLLWDSALF